MKNLKFLSAVAFLFVVMTACTSRQETMKKELTDFIRKHDSILIPLYQQTAVASWEAAISGKPEDFQKAEALNLKMMALYADKDKLKKLEEIKVSGLITDSLLIR